MSPNASLSKCNGHRLSSIVCPRTSQVISHIRFNLLAQITTNLVFISWGAGLSHRQTSVPRPPHLNMGVYCHFFYSCFFKGSWYMCIFHPRQGLFNTSFKVIVCTLLLPDAAISPHQIRHKHGVAVCPFAFPAHAGGELASPQNKQRPYSGELHGGPQHSRPRAAPFSPARGKQNPLPAPPFLSSLATSQGFPRVCVKIWWLKEWAKSGQKEHVAGTAVLPRHPFHTRKSMSCSAITDYRNAIIVACVSTSAYSLRGCWMVCNEQCVWV